MCEAFAVLTSSSLFMQATPTKPVNQPKLFSSLHVTVDRKSWHAGLQAYAPKTSSCTSEVLDVSVSLITKDLKETSHETHIICYKLCNHVKCLNSSEAHGIMPRAPHLSKQCRLIEFVGAIIKYRILPFMQLAADS